MQTKLILFFLVLICSFTLNAQENLVENLLELMQVGVIDQDASLLNSSMLEQYGNLNTIEVNQEQNGLLNNSIYSIQLQTENQAGIYQQGSGHVTVLVQNGNQNTANSWSVGGKTLTEIYQQGNGNTVNSYINNEGILPKANVLKQLGDDNTMEIALLGNGSLWFQSLPKVVDATQIGANNNLELILDHALIPGIKVTQNGGMSLVLKQSDFYFPEN
ncbi:hypothetical protein [uncultured Draconibacterium sp.]|uniref:hypothetical protein n=1 Tax=uncultured Draconibacterium sp. TaxID=1573823 RepID=UPI00326026D2